MNISKSDDTPAGQKTRRDKPRLLELQALIGYRNARSHPHHKKVFEIPKQGVVFVAIPGALLESDMWVSLRIYELRFITAAICKHLALGSAENGKIALMHQELKTKWRIPGNRIKPVIEKLTKLGLLKVTHKGGPKHPSRYRLTFLRHKEEQASGPPRYCTPTNDWIEIELAAQDGRLPIREKRHTPPKARRKATG